MKYFPGRTIEEIISLASDMTKECPNKADLINYAYNIGESAANSIYEQGDCFFESLGYRLSTVTSSAVKIAKMLVDSNFVDIS